MGGQEARLAPAGPRGAEPRSDNRLDWRVSHILSLLGGTWVSYLILSWVSHCRSCPLIPPLHLFGIGDQGKLSARRRGASEQFFRSERAPIQLDLPMRRVQSCIVVPEEYPDNRADSVMAPDLCRVKSDPGSSDCSSDASLQFVCPKTCTVGVYTDRGGCPFMEDAHLVHAIERDAFFCVYDGHGGSAAAYHCRDHLHLRILSSLGCGATPAEALVDGFARIEDELLSEQRQQLAWRMAAGSTGAPTGAPLELCGATALVALLREGSVHLAWLGDCRAVLCRGGEAVDLTRDHVLSGGAGCSERARVLAEVPLTPTLSLALAQTPNPKPNPKPNPHTLTTGRRDRGWPIIWFPGGGEGVRGPRPCDGVQASGAELRTGAQRAAAAAGGRVHSARLRRPLAAARLAGG